MLDTGATKSGRPYFVMKHVPGVAIAAALETLSCSASLGAGRGTRSYRLTVVPGQPFAGSIAFIAMSFFQLGSVAKAKAELQRLRELMKHEKDAANLTRQAFFREAEALIERAAATTQATITQGAFG